jgi:hypothetical protein
MAPNHELGILVNSNGHFDTVFKLTQAAADQGFQVCLHVQGQGAAIMKRPGFDALSHIAQVQICDSDTPETFRRPHARCKSVSAETLLAHFGTCSRQLVL